MAILRNIFRDPATNRRNNASSTRTPNFANPVSPLMSINRAATNAVRNTLTRPSKSTTTTSPIATQIPNASRMNTVNASRANTVNRSVGTGSQFASRGVNASVGTGSMFASREANASREGNKTVIPQADRDRIASYTDLSKPTDTKEDAIFNQLADEQMRTASGENVGKENKFNQQIMDQTPIEPQVPDPNAMQPQSPQAPQGSQALSQLQALRQRLAGTMTPSEQENALADELAGLRGEYETAIAGEEGAGRGRTLGLVRGRQAQLAQQAATGLGTLEERIANLQAQRMAQQQALGVEERALADELSREQQQQQFLAQQMQPFTLGGAVVRFNPATGQVETLREAPEEAVSPVTLSEGQSLVNPMTGEVIFSAPRSSDPLQQQEQMLRIQKLQQELGNDLGSGALSQEQLSRLQQTPEFKALNTVDSFYSQLQNYISLVEQFGTAGPLQSKQKLALQSAYAELGTSWKDLKGLGALTGPDLELLEQAIPNAGKPGTFGAFDPTKANRILNTLRNTEKAVALDAIRQYNRLTIQNPAYAQSDYVNTYVMPFVQSDAVTATDVANAIGYPLSEVEEARQAGYDENTLKAFILSPSFNNDLSMSQNGSLLNLGKITAYGSTAWRHGLDIDLAKGDPVPSPVDGVVEYVGPRGGFGNQVRVRDAQGNSHWLSHLDAMNVRVGQRIGKGQIVGLGGNTGTTIPGKGGDGSHLDYTVQLPNGQYMPPRQIEQFLRTS